MKGICGSNCNECDFNKKCKGCKNTNGCPFGKKCFIASYIEVGGMENYELLKKELINEFNNLNIEGISKINELFPLNGSFVLLISNTFVTPFSTVNNAVITCIPISLYKGFFFSIIPSL